MPSVNDVTSIFLRIQPYSVLIRKAQAGIKILYRLHRLNTADRLNLMGGVSQKLRPAS
jgi:hypothetical protein